MFLLAISPGQGLDPARWSRVLASGVDAVMLREPGLEPRDLLAAARWARAAAPGLELWVNGRLDVALAAGCGLHAPEAYPELSAGLLPPAGSLRLSRPVHAPTQIPERRGAAQLILSPIHEVPGKGPAWGPARLREVLDTMPPVSGRVLALGGITPENLGALRHPKLDGAALLRGIWLAPDPAAAVAALRQAWEQATPPAP
jgi:thiamine-phosphate pyrophosphorylase